MSYLEVNYMYVVRVYCNYTYKIILSFFIFMFDLDQMILEEGKNAGIRPLFWQNRRLEGGGLIPAYHCTICVCMKIEVESYRSMLRTLKNHFLLRQLN